MASAMKSRFYDNVGAVPRAEYPRPQMQRDSFLCLNGKWKYAILPKDEALRAFQGDILVPFSPECLLSGVEQIVGPDDVLYYQHTFTIPDGFLKTKSLLHFDAVDYACTVRLNGKEVGSHKGGFLPFTLDVSAAAVTGENSLEVTVTDPTNKGTQARGKQTLNPGGIWYTPQSGIWGTVWMESVPECFVEDLCIVPDIDQDKVFVTVKTDSREFTVRVLDGFEEPSADVCAEATCRGGGTAEIPMSSYELWNPEHPKLYGLEITAGMDKVTSYFGMRKFSVGKDGQGQSRLMLNNKPYFHTGVLDQGYWSDGMLTAPTDEAMVFDIQMLKDMGFNMIRKHIKIEPLRWYYHCDKIGMLVWQDMINGGGSYNPFCIAILPFLNIMIDDKYHRFFGRGNAAGRDEFERDTQATVDLLRNVPSLAMWVPFNEGWGQFDSDRISEDIARQDPTRTIDRTSGWHDQMTGDFVSKHIYFTPIWVPKDARCYLLSEFGGLAKPTKGHMMVNVPFGYRMYFRKKTLQSSFRKLYERSILANIPRGLSATVYTQVSDVEGEINGLITYDRKVEKFDRAFVKEINDRCKL